MKTHHSLKNHLLVAMPHLDDPSFYHTVTYICEHTPDGAMGLVINKPLNVNLGEVLSQMAIPSEMGNINQQPILAGGPVGTEQGFILHESKQAWKTTMVTSEDVALTTSRDILVDMAQGIGPSKSLISLGYAGWGAGQLEEEMAANYWICIPATNDIMFDLPFEERWQAAFSSIGIPDPSRIHSQVGHA